MATKRLKTPEFKTTTLRTPQPAVQITERAMTTMMSNMEDITSWNKQYVDSCVAFSTNYAKACEEMNKAWMGCCQTMMQQTMQCMKAMMAARTVKDAMETQSEYMRTSVDSVMSETTKIAELCTKLAAEMSEPMQSQWSSMVSKMSKAA